MSDQKYNGWNNYETWCANLWLTKDSGGCDWLEENARECLQRAIDDDETDIKSAAAYTLADQLQEFHQEFCPRLEGVFADLLGPAFGAIDWREIADNHIGDIDLYSAGWNSPGYMPDNTPAVFLDVDDALEYIKDQAKENIETDYAQDSRITEKSPDDLSAEVDGWTADKNGEFGNTFGTYHYFVTKV